MSERARVIAKSKSGAGGRMLEFAEGDLDKIGLSVIAKAAQSGDKGARDILNEAGDYLGAKAAFLINLFNPDIMILGRGIERAGELFLEAVRASAKRWAYEESFKVTRIVLTSLGDDSIACGAAVLVMQQVFARL